MEVKVTSDTKALVVTSGGMDSTTALFVAREEHEDVETVSFMYGQKHRIELTRAAMISRHLGAPHTMLHLPRWSKNTALTDDEHDVPEGHYADETMKQTVVPNRNMIMLSVAAGLAIDIGARYIYAGMHAGDHPVYPDCRPEFIEQMNMTIRLANEGFDPPYIVTPFITETKATIARIGHNLGVPFHLTWSCYKGGVEDPEALPGQKIHCGRCSTCIERLEAFALAEVPDTTKYADDKYWKAVTNAS